jgi:predicted dehydrogenase
VYKAGIIGLGWIGVGFSNNTAEIKQDNHLKAYQDCVETKLVAVCDTDLSRTTHVSLLPVGCVVYQNYLQMVQEMELDIVSICTPPETHKEIVCAVAPYVQAIYCEKPIATTLEDADAMIEACELSDTLLQVNHGRRFTIPKMRFSRGILDTGTHAFDLLRQLFGDIYLITKDMVFFDNGGAVEIEYVDTTDKPWDKSHIFELDCVHNNEPMILKGLEHLIECLNQGTGTVSDGIEARESLRCTLEYGELIGKL